jgi:glucokinase
MNALGLEIRDAAAAAVAVDEGGAVLARALVETTGDVQPATLEAVDAVAGVGGSNLLGIAAAIQSDAAASAAVLSLKQRYRGPFVEQGMTSPGHAAAVAEAWIGAARGASNVVFFAVGGHAIAGVVLNGEPMIGAGRRAASIAWLALNPVEREDYRKVGCLEAEVAAAGIVRRLIWRIKAGDWSRVPDMAGGDLSAVTVDHVLSAAREGDGVSVSVMRDTAKYLGMAAANLVLVTDPEMLVLGGIMATSSDLLSEPVSTELARRLPRQMMDGLTIVSATLGEDASAIGAARLAMVALK